MKFRSVLSGLVVFSVVLGASGSVSGTTETTELTAEQVIALNKAREEGRILFQQRKYREAAEAYRRATQIDSTDAPTYFNLGLCYQGLNASTDAVAALRRAVALDPKFGPAHLEIAKVLLKENQLEAAEKEYTATQSLLADSVQYLMAAEQGLQTLAIAYTNRAILSIRRHNYSKATSDAERAIRLAPDMSRPYYIGARIDEIQHNYESARERYRLAAEKAQSPKARSEALGGLGRVSVAMAREAQRANRNSEAGRARREAIKYFRESVKADSTNQSSFLNLGNALFEAEQYAAARDALIRAEHLKHRDYKAPFKLAETYMKLGQCSEAETAASRSIRLQPSNASAHATRAEALECLGRLREALHEYKLAKRDPRWRQRASYKIKKIKEKLGLPTS